MKRRLEIDALRGLMLVWMTMTHLPTVITKWVNQPFGYISASEGFIFLSALFTGRIYFRLLERDGPRAMSGRLTMRTIRLYGYHCGLLFFAFVIAAQWAVRSNRPGLYNLLDFYFAAGPARALADGLALIYRPPLLDIIPLYIIFLLLSPLALLLANRIGWKWLLGAGAVLWVLAQFGMRQFAYNFLARHCGLRIPLNEMGAFDLWGWQLLWIVGLWCGVRWAKNDLPTEDFARRFVAAGLVIAPLFLAIRYAEIMGFHRFGLGTWEPLFDKWHLGVFRLVDAAGIAAVLIYFQRLFKPLAIRPLVMMGQASLQVFCAHFLFCFAGLAIMGGRERLHGWGQVAFGMGTFAALLVVAKIFSKSEAKAGAPKAEGSVIHSPLREEPQQAA
jgi:hypothetical protein